MAMNRYGRIYHSDHHYNTLRFPSADARSEFVEKFDKHHASHDHDGEVPRFENVTAAEANKVKVHDASEVTIDGYASHEIHAYHDRNDDSYVHYRPPTTIAPLVIVTEMQGAFIDSSTLTRHELSAIFMDMPDEDFQNLLKSVERDGFKDPIIRMIDTQVLDGWHRYRAAKELNLLRKLRFRQWKEQDEGDPAAFVLARNIERRHLTPGQRGQIVVSFNERFGHGGDRKSDEIKTPNGVLKTKQELAKEAGVGTSTIDRAVQVEKSGQAEQVISGEKTAGQVIEEMTIQELWKQINPAISEWKKAREGVGHASKTMFIHATLRWEGLEHNADADVKVLKELLNLLTTKETNILEELIRKQLDGKSLWDDAEDLAEKRQLALDAEHRMFAALDEVAPDWDYDDFIAAALDKHSDWGATELPDIDALDVPQIWEGRYDLLTREIKEPADWIQQMLDRMAEPTESEQQTTKQPTQSAEEREANKLLKQKKRILKSIWDKRKQATKDWLGTEDNDLTTYTDLDALEKAFVKCEDHKFCADAFQSGMRRTAEQSFNICLEKMLASDVSLETLEAEYNAVNIYAFDILQWKRQEWIQQLIAKNKAKADAKAETESGTTQTEEVVPKQTEQDLWDTLRKRIPKWKEKYASQGYSENELIQAATDDELIEAYISYREANTAVVSKPVTTDDGELTLDGIQDLTETMRNASFPYALAVRRLMKERHAELVVAPEPENADDKCPVHYIIVAWHDSDTGKDKSVFFNSKERLERKVNGDDNRGDNDTTGMRSIEELPESIADQLLLVARLGKSTDIRESITAEETNATEKSLETDQEPTEAETS